MGAFRDMMIGPFQRHHTGQFLALAAAEQWVTGQEELDFLLSCFPAGCFCIRDETGNGAGFVTSLRHGSGGWIGNLIVRPDLRGKGIGEVLLLRGVGALQAAGAETIWLTASEMGRPLYEKHGFATIDRIIRWAGEARGLPDAVETYGTASFDRSLDALCWGDRRDRLLEWVTGRGLAIAEQGASAILQSAGAAIQLGPWVAAEGNCADRLFAVALSVASAGTKIICDTPLSNETCQKLFQKAGFSRRGETRLMCSGAQPAYRPEYLYALATLGSSG
jgi:ribosomal protein S18 acetylase RimI-like enzyme